MPVNCVVYCAVTIVSSNNWEHGVAPTVHKGFILNGKVVFYMTPLQYQKTTKCKTPKYKRLKQLFVFRRFFLFENSRFHKGLLFPKFTGRAIRYPPSGPKYCLPEKKHFGAPGLKP